jgi:hypothetical protein
MYGTYFLQNIMSQQHFLGMSTKLWKATISFVISVCLHGTTQFPLEQIFMKLDI